MKKVFDQDYVQLKKVTIRYSIIVLVFFCLIIFLMEIIHKERIYENIIEFIDSKKALILVDHDYLEKIKKTNKIYLDNISYDYSVITIEEKEEIYLVTINFSEELLLSTQKYQIYLEKESLLNYIIRLIKGEKNEKIK